MKDFLFKAGIVEEADIKGGIHLPIESYAEIINKTISELSMHILNHNEINENKLVLIAARLNIEFKQEIQMNEKYTIYIVLEEINERFLHIRGRICIHEKVRTKWDATVIVWNKEKKQNEEISNKMRLRIVELSNRV